MLRIKLSVFVRQFRVNSPQHALLIFLFINEKSFLTLRIFSKRAQLFYDEMSAYGEKRKKRQWLTLIILQPASHFTTTITFHITIRVHFFISITLLSLDSYSKLEFFHCLSLMSNFYLFNDFINFKKLIFQFYFFC